LLELGQPSPWTHARRVSRDRGPLLMAYDRLALLAVALAAGSAAHSTGTKWVPLNQIKAGTANERVTSPPAPSRQPTIAPVSIPEPATPAQVVVPGTAQQPAPPSAVGGLQQALQITCLGGGTANKATAATAYSWGSFSGSAGNTWVSGSGSGTTTVFGTRQQGFDEQVDIRLFNGDDRIRLPRTMLPPIHGGDAGWFKLKNVVADSRSIRANAAINFMSNPKVYIDRLTGTISISGRAGDYTGRCQAFAPSAPARF
jgi:hypothetical protein